MRKIHMIHNKQNFSQCPFILQDDDPWAAPEQPPSSTREEFSEDVSTSFSIENLIRETDG